jgi:selenocysteine lyase/cysteine desulfurase
VIYLDSAATSCYRPPEVKDALGKALETMGNGSRGVHGPALEAARTVYRARCLADELFHGYGPEQTVFTANATESLNIAVKGLLQPGDRAVTTVLDHNSVLRPLAEMEAAGVEVLTVGCAGGMQSETGTDTSGPCGSARMQGLPDYGALEKAIASGVRAVICTHASNLTGNVLDIRRLGRMCREYGALFILDAAQTAGRFPLDMQKEHIDVLCFTGHKGLLGPQGTGGLCVRKGLRIRPLKSGGSGIRTFSRTQPEEMPEALEAGTLNGHGIAGLAAGLSYVREKGAEALLKREQELAWRFYQRIRSIPEIRIYGDFSSPYRVPIVALNMGGEDSGKVSLWLWERYGICTRSGGHCAPLMHRALGTEEQGAVRFSFSHFNTEEQVETAAEALRRFREEQ